MQFFGNSRSGRISEVKFQCSRVEKEREREREPEQTRTEQIQSGNELLPASGLQAATRPEKASRSWFQCNWRDSIILGSDHAINITGKRPSGHGRVEIALASGYGGCRSVSLSLSLPVCLMSVCVLQSLGFRVREKKKEKEKRRK